ncbi:MAG: serine/threonine protein phosphatase [Magnetococcales bacterium]|nr:serine/threonine protein phosphatase [Magnetococcales bacterium]
MLIPLRVRPYSQCQEIKGICFPPGVRFQQILIIGPPGVGKSSQMQRMGGWIEEGHLDLALPFWWRSKALVFIPRELHLYFPFQGVRESLSVYSPEWMANPLPLDFPRIRVPRQRDSLFVRNWHKKFALEFLLPPPEKVFEWRRKRAIQKTHPVDDNLTLELVTQQLLVFWNIAKHLHRCGMQVYLREGIDEPPLEIVDTMDYPDAGCLGGCHEKQYEA